METFSSARGSLAAASHIYSRLLPLPTCAMDHSASNHLALRLYASLLTRRPANSTNCQLANPPTRQPADSLTRQLANLPTCRLTDPLTCRLVDSLFSRSMYPFFPFQVLFPVYLERDNFSSAICHENATMSRLRSCPSPSAPESPFHEPCRHHAHSPRRITGSTVPDAVTPSTSSSADPIIQSTWIRLVLAPRAASSSGLSLSPSRTHDE